MITFNVKNKIKDCGFTQLEFAKKTGIRLETVSNLCTGKTKQIPVEVLNKLCEALNCKPGDLLDFYPEENFEEGC